MATYAPNSTPETETEVPEEFREPETKPVEKAPEISKTPEMGQTGENVSNPDLEAEVLFQVAHYNDEYKSPASEADIAFEIQEKDSDVHKAMEMAVEEGTPKVEPIIRSLVEQGLIMETEFGGYITTPDGDAMLENTEVQSELGNTYESKKHKGNPADTGYGDENDDEDEEPEKVESGVPFM